MLVTLTATARPNGPLTDARDLGHLLHKHPDRAQRFELPVGVAHVFYPEATAERTTVALLLEVDPVGIVRNKRFGTSGDFSLAQYVNDRPYAASSLLAVALGKVFSTATAGRSGSLPELAESALPLTVHVPSLPCRGGTELAESMFAPLGWKVGATPVPLDPEVPAWGDSRYVDLTLTGEVRLADALRHLYVLLPVLDGAKHYWVGTDEIDKLLRNGEGWLAAHPHREEILRRYLAHQRRYVEDATARLLATEEPDDDGEDDAVAVALTPEGADGDAAAPPPSLAALRSTAVVAALRSERVGSVVDLGCGEGALLRHLQAERSFTRILGTDVSVRALERAAERLDLRGRSDAERDRLTLLQSSLTYRDDRLQGFDAAVLMEVIEHLDLDRLPALEDTVFAHARPRVVVVTTPNAEYNATYPHLHTGPDGRPMRHTDHRFEWTRAELAAWADGVAGRHGYTVSHAGIGPADPVLGAPTQLALFVAGADA
ncbi:3' terminal RNA ribose 2'-O-methyltransferase Hen1 [Serinibacter arcticus]|uniref:Small RNA 2'-O-methyltransferase n=1 Tax=Serinibacter arcticus TaxID=1655435 RepID=A0A2U1ZXT4_9MICO|nr:3' terminal RNA ribose 2'-O-methyltransferase Hen1 [Serinibacter arcticus]PWD51796.1 3' terminal RNA ribose 2'-O-methyltransferase Hen1 [Serinibacter arcticus]